MLSIILLILLISLNGLIVQSTWSPTLIATWHPHSFTTTSYSTHWHRLNFWFVFFFGVIIIFWVAGPKTIWLEYCISKSKSTARLSPPRFSTGLKGTQFYSFIYATKIGAIQLGCTALLLFTRHFCSFCKIVGLDKLRFFVGGLVFIFVTFVTEAAIQPFFLFSQLLKPGLRSQRHSALISSDSEYFQLCFSAVHYLKISEQRWFSSEQRWKRKFSELKISAETALIFSETALKHQIFRAKNQPCSVLFQSCFSLKQSCFRAVQGCFPLIQRCSALVEIRHILVWNSKKNTD